MRSPDEDDGAGSVLVLAMCVLAIVAALAAASLLGSVAASRRAQAAADLGALAGAQRILDATRTGDDANECQRAAQIASVNGGVLQACRVDGEDVLVRASVRLHGLWLLGSVSAAAQARAGPPATPVPDSAPIGVGVHRVAG